MRNHFVSKNTLFNLLDLGMLFHYADNLTIEEQGKYFMSPAKKKFKVERVQLGVRMEKRLVKVMKAMAEYHDMSLGDLMEGIVLHAFEGTSPFSEQSIEKIKQLKEIYGVDYDSSASHQFTEEK